VAADDAFQYLGMRLTARKAVVSFARVLRWPPAERGQDREADPISDHRTRRYARLTSVDVRARRYALRLVQPSPARQEAPEPNAWLPIDLTLDLTGELELLEIEEGQVDLDRELAELEADFWRTAEHEHPFLTGALPTGEHEAVRPEVGSEPAALEGAPAVPPATDPVPALQPPHTGPGVAPISVFADREPEARAEAAPVPLAEPEPVAEPLPVPEEYARLRPNRPAIASHRRAVRLRRRLIVTVLVVACSGALAVVTARVLGGMHPRRDVTVSVDGDASTIVTREGTVGDLLASRGIALHDGDRVVPSTTTALEQGMPIHVYRSFPMTADVDGTLVEHRTTRHDPARVRRELNLPGSLVRVDGHGEIRRGTRMVLRTPHDVSITVDGATTAFAHQTALTVADLLAAHGITLGPNDQVDPALDAHLGDGTPVHVYRLTPDTVMENKIIPFRTEYRNDATLAAGHLATVQAGRNGVAHVFSNVVRQDGQIVRWTVVREEVVQAPVTQILRRGTKPSGTQRPPASPMAATGGPYQSGTATWYDSHAGSGSCAHLRLPFGTIVKIVASNGNTAQCRVGDRGPEAWTGNIIDLNRDVFAQLAPLGTGKLSVTLYVVG
jgi:uncharacterized protein YabE (DUF348 family)